MRILFLLGVVFLGFLFYVRYLERVTTFVPSKIMTATPDDIGLQYEDIYFSTKDGIKLNAWFIPNQNEVSTVLFLHGNAGNLSDRLEKIKILYDVGLSVFIFDYRGYGNSTGRPTEKGIYEDAVSAFDYLNKKVQSKIIVYGASLGGAPAVELAIQRRIDALVIDSSFSSAADMANHIYPWMPTMLLKNKLDLIGKIGLVQAPKIFFHSTDDEVVPIALSHKLYEAAKEPKEFITIEGTHVDVHMFDIDNFKTALSRFVRQYGR